MAYDPKDPNDVKTVQALIDAAVTAAVDTANEEHEAATAGLKAKTKELLGKLRKAESGEAGDPAEVARLEDELQKSQKALKDAEKSFGALTKEKEALAAERDKEAGFSKSLLVGNGLTDALVAAGVKKELLPATKALLKDQVTIKEDGDNRLVMVGDKSLGDFVKEWSQGDEGKHYVAAGENGGGGSGGGKANPNNNSSGNVGGTREEREAAFAAKFPELQNKG